MRNRSAVALLVVLCGLAPIRVPAGDAQTARSADAHLTYTLELLQVADAPREYMWRVEAPYGQAVRLDGVVFRSLKSPTLRQWVSQLPEGTAIAYTPYALPLIKLFGDPEGGVGDFARFCRSRHLQFGFNPVL